MMDFLHKWLTRGWVIVTLAVTLASVMIIFSGPAPAPVQVQAIKPWT